MANKRVRDNSALLYSGVASGDCFFIDDLDADVDKKITAGEVKKYVLDNHVVGGSAAGDITTNNGTQTLTGKTLTSPKVNENVAVSVTATKINNACATVSTTAELDLNHTYGAKFPYLANVTSDIQGQINGLGISPEFLLHCYADTFVAGATSKAYTESDIIDAIGLSSSTYYIDPATLNIQICSISGGTYTVIEDTANVTTTVSITAGVTHVNEVKLAGLTPSSNHNIAMHFKLILIPGI